MKYILRILISGLTAICVTIAVIQLEGMGIIAETATGALKGLYDNKEILAFILSFVSMFFSIGIPLSKKIATKLEDTLSKYTMQEILMYIIGVGIGLYVANLVSEAFEVGDSVLLNKVMLVLLYIALGCFGIYLVHLKKSEIRGWISKTGDILTSSSPKILDTSVIIDGRILDIMSTGFIEGKVIIPSFVLDELRHIADSSDSLKRNRGRRGLDILSELKNVRIATVEVVEVDYPDIKEVDSKLLKLAHELQGKVVTNDFNLNKVAKLQKIQVLNINDLANSIKQVVLPKEEMKVTVVKEGKEENQGLSYLSDGTMIVVENGRKYVGKNIEVIVTTVLQTSAGRMIFAKVK